MLDRKKKMIIILHCDIKIVQNFVDPNIINFGDPNIAENEARLFINFFEFEFD